MAIKLNLREEEVARLYTEYWKLSNLHALAKAYDEIKEYLQYFLELYRLTKAAGMNSEMITRILNIANGDLLSIERRYRVLQSEILDLETKKQNSSSTYWKLKDDIYDLENEADSLRCACTEQRLELTRLRIEKLRVEESVNKIQNNGGIKSKIREMAKREVEVFLSNKELISKLIFESVVKSMRREPASFPHPQHDSTLSRAHTQSLSMKKNGYMDGLLS